MPQLISLEQNLQRVDAFVGKYFPLPADSEAKQEFGRYLKWLYRLIKPSGTLAKLEKEDRDKIRIFLRSFGYTPRYFTDAVRLKTR